ncbi:hypothetical protein ACIG56_32160 [Nocardia fusca]|uniref:hypothetical protein n=1 Tax=Nocardia fusca TaxID=941183 RepID=UPI0037C7871F
MSTLEYQYCPPPEDNYTAAADSEAGMPLPGFLPNLSPRHVSGQNRSEQIAPGYEQLAATLAELLAGLPSLPLDGDDEAEVRTNVGTVLAEVVEEEPNQGRIKRGLTMIKGLLSPIATSAIEAASEESAELARTVIQDLGSSLPF